MGGKNTNRIDIRSNKNDLVGAYGVSRMEGEAALAVQGHVAPRPNKVEQIPLINPTHEKHGPPTLSESPAAISKFLLHRDGMLLRSARTLTGVIQGRLPANEPATVVYHNATHPLTSS